MPRIKKWVYVLCIFIFVCGVMSLRINAQYVEGYEENSNGTIIVTMTTIPERITSNTISKTLKSISLQTRSPDIIYINVPLKTKKMVDYPIEDLYKIAQDYNNVKINVIDEDLGPITKIVPTLQHVNSNDYVILVDDDVQYIPEMIETLINANKDAVGFAGRKNLDFLTSEYYTGPVDFLETFAGVLYRGDALLGLDEYYKTVQSVCNGQDDIVIGKFLKTKNITPEIIPSSKFPAEHNAEGTPELRHENVVNGANSTCYNRIWNL